MAAVSLNDKHGWVEERARAVSMSASGRMQLYGDVIKSNKRGLAETR